MTSTMESESVKTFRALHDGPGLLCLANAWDAGSARLVESLGAPAVATTSAGFAWALGHADGERIPAAVAIAAAGNVARVLSVPLSVDVEGGWAAEPAAVAENVAALSELGVAGINIEDGDDSPKLLAAKVAAIRASSAVFVNVRTDVYLRGLAPEADRVAEVLARAERYRDAGADGLFVPGICVPDEIAAVAEAAGLPLNVMAWPGLPSNAELTALGVRRFSAGASIAAAVWGVARELTEAFLAGTVADAPSHWAMDYGEIQQLFG
jgi:2-methylisocitrate lyase-like PEP mutase family enzyme